MLSVRPKGRVRATGRAMIVALGLLVSACGTAPTMRPISASTTASPNTTTVPTTVSPTTASPTTVSPTTVAHHPASTLILVGDSLAVEASQYFELLLVSVELVPYPFSGTAPCDWFTLDMRASPSTVVVLSFHGNAFTPCMQDASGAPYTGAALVEKYRVDVGILIDRAVVSGSDVVLVGQPENGPTFPRPQLVGELNSMYAELALERGVGYVDAGASVEAPDGSFVSRLPCLPDEIECGLDGTNVVRSDDGVHFCPVSGGFDECPVYSSGAFRYALAIASLACVI